MTKLDERMKCHAGELLARVMDLDFMLERGFTITPDDITVEEFSALKVLSDARSKYGNELALEAKRKQQMEQQAARPISGRR